MAKKTYTTLTDVPLIRVGGWNPAEGDGDVTLDILENVVAASIDSRLNIPVIKLGHVDKRFENPDYFEDGEPAYGQITNLRVTDDEGGTLVGDLINIPQDLVDVMESAYPFRSVEVHFGVQLTDAEGTLIEEFPAVLTALALLGEAPPAVSGLGAIHEAFSGKAASGKAFRVDTSGRFALTAGHTFESLRTHLRTHLRTALQSTAGESEYLWVSDLDDSMVIYERENGDGYTCWREGFTINLDGTVVLNGQPEQVVRTTSYAPVAQNAVLPHFKSGEPHSGRVQKPAAHVAAGQSTTPQTMEDTVTPEQIETLREQGLLSADVTDDAVLAALNPAADSAAEVEAVAAAAAAVEAPAPVAAGAQVPATVRIEAASFADMQTRLARAEQTIADNAKQETAKRHNQIIATAKSAGRLHPDNEQGWRNLLASNEQQATSLLADLQPVIHTRELGSDAASFTVDADTAVSKAQADLDSKIFGGK